MLTITLTRPYNGPQTKSFNASVLLRDGNDGDPSRPDRPFFIGTYRKINEDKTTGEQIIYPINLFFKTLTQSDHQTLYDFYQTCESIIEELTSSNLRDIQVRLQNSIYDTMTQLGIPEKLITFCATDVFKYPDVSWVGTEAHHTEEKTYREQDYIEITAISLLSKLMMPIWGNFVEALRVLDFKSNSRQKLAFDIVEPVLENGVLERVYAKLRYKVETVVNEKKTSMERISNVNVPTSFIMAHSAVDDDILNDIVMATLIVKRMATYGCIDRLNNGNLPDVVVYLTTQIKQTADSTIRGMKTDMNIMPLRELSERDSEDNSSILDHASKTSKKPMDIPITITTLGERYEIPRLLIDTNTPLDVYEAAAEFYQTNSFEPSPLTQALVSSFVGDRFGGSKCNNYLPVHLYQRVVVILQIFLIRHNLVDLAALTVAVTPAVATDGFATKIAGLVESNMKTSSEYLLCNELFKGFVEKVMSVPGRRGKPDKPVTEKIDFTSHVSKMKDWIIRHNHYENMAPALWVFSQDPNPTPLGEECRYDKNIIAYLCRFYLMFHNRDIKRPF